LIYQTAIPSLTDEAAMTPWLEEVEQRLNQGLPTGTSYKLSVGANGDASYVNVSFNRHGINTDYHVPSEFFASNEYQKIVDFSNKINGLVGVGSYVERGERRESITNFAQAVAWLLSEARRGQHVQRYKGLGEMNPEQLWETTMDKDKRRLLQVKIEDAIAADETFNTLMGDNVEPRREFIEKHALQASNLDI
jgi:DNA gyrase subunit B